MQFLYHENAGEINIKIIGEQYAHLFKARRKDAAKPLFLRNLKDENIYEYNVLGIDKREAFCALINTQKGEWKSLHINIAWAVVEPKIIERALPFLNEFGVAKIILIYTKFSQRNFKIDFERLKRIAINSCEQCGRGDLIEFELYNSLDEFLKNYSDIGVVDFSPNRFCDIKEIPKTWLVGCEGGFAEVEREKLKNFITIGFEGGQILRSESAVLGIAAKLLL